MRGMPAHNFPKLEGSAMKKIAFLFTLLVTALVCLLPAVPAHAGAPRTFLSAAGNDSNSCANVVTPCRHLAAAFAATAADGEIYVLDPANYGSLTITHGVSIEGHGWASIAPVSGSPAITINANAGDAINIIGVVLDGTALAGTTGIQFNSGGNLVVRDSVIRNFGGSGIAFAPTSSAEFAVSNTLVANNGSLGIYVQPSGNNIRVIAVFNRVEAYNNNMGIGLYGNFATGVSDIEATAVDCVTSNNIDTGYYVLGGTIHTNFQVFRSTSQGDNIGVKAEAGGQAYVSQSNLWAGLSWSNTSGSGTVVSYGDNDTQNFSAPNGVVAKH
jgi:hypothetical protein